MINLPKSSKSFIDTIIMGLAIQLPNCHSLLAYDSYIMIQQQMRPNYVIRLKSPTKPGLKTVFFSFFCSSHSLFLVWHDALDYACDTFVHNVRLNPPGSKESPGL